MGKDTDSGLLLNYSSIPTPAFGLSFSCSLAHFQPIFLSSSAFQVPEAVFSASGCSFIHLGLFLSQEVSAYFCILLAIMTTQTHSTETG